MSSSRHKRLQVLDYWAKGHCWRNSGQAATEQSMLSPITRMFLFITPPTCTVPHTTNILFVLPTCSHNLLAVCSCWTSIHPKTSQSLSYRYQLLSILYLHSTIHDHCSNPGFNPSKYFNTTKGVQVPYSTPLHLNVCNNLQLCRRSVRCRYAFLSFHETRNCF